VSAAVPAESIVYERPFLYPKQEAALFTPKRYAVIEASTKSGKTAGCIVWLLEQAFLQGRPGRAFAWVAPVFSQSKMVFRRMKAAIPADLYVANETELYIKLANGAVIWFKSGENPDTLFGEDYFAVVLDEATRIKEASWQAIRSTLTATRGPVRIIGNVRGRGNWAYRLARKAEGNIPNYSYSKLTAYDAIEGGILDAEEIEDAKRVLPESVFRELYLAEPSEDGSCPFDMKAISDCTAPMGQGPATTWGWDLARGRRADADWTVGIGLNKAREGCQLERFQAPWAEQMERIRACTGSVPALVDATGVGDPVVEALQRQGGSYEGFKFSAQSKQDLMAGLVLSISQRAIKFPEGVIVNELMSFEYEYTRTLIKYSAPEGLNDDAVCALALANKHFSEGGPRVRFI